MPQMQLPIFPCGATHINPNLAFSKEDGLVTYFTGHMPVFTHLEGDVQTFRLITAQFCAQGNTTQAEIAKAFGVTLISVKRAVKICRDKGPSGFYETPRRRGSAVLLPQVLAEAQEKLDQGLAISEVAAQLHLKANTLAKAVRDGRLLKGARAQETHPDGRSRQASSKSERSADDSKALMGTGATNTRDRQSASMGLLDEVAIDFKPSLDVSHAGVLFALPALLASGLLRRTEKHFKLPRGYYGLKSIFLLLAFMSLARLKSVERLRYCAPGEWGKMLGLDRVPEVRTLRAKIDHLCDNEHPVQWSVELCRDWMKDSPESAATCYVDGHVRVYHGKQTKLPRHYVAREKLCLRATTDYWVNAMDGQPFLVINKAVDPGLLSVLENDIIPRLEDDIPGQPTAEALAGDPLRHRFTVIFDREGYSPDFMRRMKDRRIACLTYHKYQGQGWPVEEFTAQQVRLANGNVVEMQLAERGVWLGKKVWVREVRKLTSRGHQTSILSTDYRSDLTKVAAAMFARWSQENFFKYMREHYSLDRLVDYCTEDIPDTTCVVNPAYRELEGRIRSKRGIRNRKLAEFGGLTLEGELAPQKVQKYSEKKAALLEEATSFQKEIEELKSKRKGIAKHITMSQLPQEQSFQRLSTQSKHLLDTIKMIAYRAETALVYVLREKMSRHDDARSLVQGIFDTEADILPDENAGTLTVRLHHLAAPCADVAVRHLCEELNSTATVFPGTDLRLIYDLVCSTAESHEET